MSTSIRAHTVTLQTRQSKESRERRMGGLAREVPLVKVEVTKIILIADMRVIMTMIT